MNNNYTALVLIPLACLLIAGVWYYWPSQAIDPSFRADEVVITKSQHRLTLKKDGKTVKNYRISLAFNPRSRKVCDGDGRTPEGTYYVTRKSSSTKYSKTIDFSYPNGEDRRRAREEGCDPRERIMIHGLPHNLSWLGPFHRPFMWTDGNIMLSDSDMDELQQAIPSATLIMIYP